MIVQRIGGLFQRSLLREGRRGEGGSDTLCLSSERLSWDKKCRGSHNHYGRINESCQREHNDTLGLMETQYILLEFHPRIGHPIVCECGMEEHGVRHDCRSDDPNCKEEFGHCAKSGYDCASQNPR